MTWLQSAVFKPNTHGVRSGKRPVPLPLHGVVTEQSLRVEKQHSTLHFTVWHLLSCSHVSTGSWDEWWESTAHLRAAMAWEIPKGRFFFFSSLASDCLGNMLLFQPKVERPGFVHQLPNSFLVACECILGHHRTLLRIKYSPPSTTFLSWHFYCLFLLVSVLALQSALPFLKYIDNTYKLCTSNVFKSPSPSPPPAEMYSACYELYVESACEISKE